MQVPFGWIALASLRRCPSHISRTIHPQKHIAFVHNFVKCNSIGPMPRKPAPRVSGMRLRALAAALRSPIGGSRLARVLMVAGGLPKLRKRQVQDRTRPVIVFRAGPRPPRDD